jgi:predicted GIY-YIG superfamily endonuclease
MRTIVKAEWMSQAITAHGQSTSTPHRVHGARIEWIGNEPRLVVTARCGKDYSNPKWWTWPLDPPSHPCKPCARQPAYVVYRFYNAKWRLLYVGMTSNFGARRSAHRSSSRWFKYARFTIQRHYDDRQSAAAAELEAIRTEHPIFNTQHAVVSFTKTERRRMASA